MALQAEISHRDGGQDEESVEKGDSVGDRELRGEEEGREDQHGERGQPDQYHGQQQGEWEIPALLRGSIRSFVGPESMRFSPFRSALPCCNTHLRVSRNN